MRYVILSLFLSISLQASTNYTDISQNGINWASIDINAELTTVANEIQSLINTTNAVNEVGDNAVSSVLNYVSTNKWTYRGMQQMVNNEYDNFISGTNSLDGATNTDAQAVLIAYSNWVHFATEAGLSTNGWRRATTNWPSDWTDKNDPAYQYGTIQSGDYMGPWIVDDLQLAFSRMKKRLYFADWGLETNVVNRKYGEEELYYTNGYSTVWASAVANYNASSITNATSDPRSTSRFGGGYFFNFTLNSIKNQAYATISHATNVSATAYFYIHTTAFFHTPSYTATYDANGDSVAEDQWSMFSSITLPVDREVYSDFVGDLSVPADPGGSDWVEGTPIETLSRGWVETSGIEPKTVVEFEWSYTRE